MGFMNAILAITTPGDEIILNTPYYFNHEMAITMAGRGQSLIKPWPPLEHHLGFYTLHLVDFAVAGRL